MLSRDQTGAINSLVFPFVVTVMILIGALIFAVWAYSSRQDYKNNVDAKINVAVGQATQKEDQIKAAQYAEESKQPLRTYNGPEAYGSLVVNFPITWSGYVDDTGTGGSLVDGYFNPGTVPSISAQAAVFALRVQVLGQSYATTLQSFSSDQQSGNITVNAYSLPKLPKVVGVEVTGLLNQVNTTMVVLPLRSDTLEIWTQGNQYVGDFNNYILPNFSFSP
jgi:hypothetical protein